MLKVVVSKDYFIVVNILSLFKHTFFLLSKMPDISHCNYFARSWKKAHQLHTSLFEIMESLCSKTFKMSISKQDVCINKNLENGYAKINTDL